MLSRRRFLAASAAGIASAAGLSPRALAQSIGKTAHIVVGFPPGGTVDIVARLIAERLRGGYAASVLVENKPGAAGRIAAEYVKNAEADGSTILLTPASMITVFPHLYKKLTYDPARDFVPVTPACIYDFAFAVGPAVPAKTLQEFIAWAKANPKQAAFASPAAGSIAHFAGVLGSRAMGLDLLHVPYKGMAPAVQDLLGGQVPTLMGVAGDLVPHHRAGKVRVLATTGPARLKQLPDVPTFKELGFRDVEVREWYGFFAPAKTPPSTVAALNKAIVEAIGSPAVQEGLAKFAFDPFGRPLADFSAMVKADYANWGPIVKASGFTPDE